MRLLYVWLILFVLFAAIGTYLFRNPVSLGSVVSNSDGLAWLAAEDALRLVSAKATALHEQLQRVARVSCEPAWVPLEPVSVVTIPCDCEKASSGPQRPEATPVAEDPLVCVVVRMRGSSVLPLLATVHSLLVTRPPNVHLFLYQPDVQAHADLLPTMRSVADQINALYGQPYAEVSHVTQALVSDRWRNVTTDYGYLALDHQLEILLGIAQNSSNSSSNVVLNCSYVMFTDTGNLYSARLWPLVTPLIRAGTSMIGWDFVSPFRVTDGLGYRPGVHLARFGRGQQYFTAFAVGQIDLGAMLLYASTLRETKIRFCIDRIRTGDATGCEFVADGYLAQRLATIVAAKEVISEALMLKE